jgi:hypothetical protein
MLAEAQLRVLLFRLQQYSSTFALLQLSLVPGIMASPGARTFQQQVLDCHNRMEQQRQ